MSDGKISRRGNCRWVIACGFGTELCRQADVRHEECREIAVSRDQVQRFSEFRFTIRPYSRDPYPYSRDPDPYAPGVNWPGKW